jgi:cell division protein FtsQ
MSAARASRGRKPAARKRPAKATANHKRANKLAAVAFGLFVLAIGAVVIVALGLPAKAMTAAGEAVGSAGFTVKRVDVKGIKRMDSEPVYRIAFDQQSMAMPLVDVSAIRQKLLRYGWVKDARVSRRLPDTLVIDIVERQPAALWQDQQRLALIDSEGVVLDRVRVDQMPDLPLLIGPGANAQAELLQRLLAAAPTLKPQLASATWVGQRRWDLAFQSGETIALPEGDVASRGALAKFARMDRSSGLLGRGLVRFDLRVPGKMIVRLPRAPGEAITPEPSAEG